MNVSRITRCALFAAMFFCASGSFQPAAAETPNGASWARVTEDESSIKINSSPEMFLRNDTPGCVRHTQGDTFSEIYLSYLGGPDGLRIPSSEFFTPFPPDAKFGYRRDTYPAPSDSRATGEGG